MAFTPKQRGAIFEKLKGHMAAMPSSKASQGFKKIKGISAPEAPMEPAPLVDPPQHPIQKVGAVESNMFNSPTQYVGNGKMEHFKRIKRIFGI